MTQISYHFQSISDAVAQVKRTIDTLQGYHGDIKQGLVPLKEVWQGQNGVSFDDFHTAVSQNYQEVLDIFVDYHNRLTTVLDNAGSTSNAITKFLSV